MKSTLLKKVNADPNDFDIRLEFAKWNKAGGVKSNGLVNRRSEESALYYTAN
jgi:GH24 family phage-related lysozyme (muramidase)